MRKEITSNLLEGLPVKAYSLFCYVGGKLQLAFFPCFLRRQIRSTPRYLHFQQFPDNNIGKNRLGFSFCDLILLNKLCQLGVVVNSIVIDLNEKPFYMESYLSLQNLTSKTTAYESFSCTK